MILGIGIDLVSVSRVESLFFKFKDKFLQKIFTKNEIDQAKKIFIVEKRILFFAKRFAAKEAFAKAIGLGIGRGINFQDIEIFNDKFGRPLIKILNNKERFLKKHFVCKKLSFHLSLTDENLMASAVVLIEKII